MLTTAALHDGDLDRAIGELMANATRLALAGHAKEAREALELLVQAGPWRLPAHGELVHRLERLLPPVSLLAEEDCPAIGDQPAMTFAQSVDWAEAEAHRQLRSLAQVGRNQLKPAGAAWSADFLATLPQRCGAPTEPRPHVGFGAFCIDAEFVLKARIAQRFGCSTAALDAASAEELESLGLPADELALLMAQLSEAGRIDIAPAAEAIDTLEIARAVAEYLRATGFVGGYLDPVFAGCWLLLVDEGREPAAVEVARAWLRQDEGAPARMLDFAVVPSVRRFLSAGSLVPAMQLSGIDGETARTWLAALSSRRPTAAAQAVTPAHAAPPAPSAEAFHACLHGTPLQQLRWLEVPVPDSSDHAWAARVPVADRRSLWQAARALLAQTGRWPLVTTLWSGRADSVNEDDLSDELFMRSPYAQGPSRDDISPRSFIASSQSIDLGEFMAGLAEREFPLDDDTQKNVWRDELNRAGITGPAQDGFEPAWDACGGDRLCFERWLAAQEAMHGVADADLGRQPGFDPDNAWLVLLPTPRSEDALAYVHWYGIERGSADGFIRLLRDWRERHGAELWAHYGTMLEFVVDQPPQDLDGALALAREHELAAPCTLMLPGIPLRHHALGLVGHAAWFLHERP